MKSRSSNESVISVTRIVVILAPRDEAVGCRDQFFSQTTASITRTNLQASTDSMEACDGFRLFDRLLRVPPAVNHLAERDDYIDETGE
jgi:hypothetical protein